MKFLSKLSRPSPPQRSLSELIYSVKAVVELYYARAARIGRRLLTGRRHGDRRFIKWTRLMVKASWLNIRRKCCKACGTGTQERYCLIQDACAC